jgi:3'-phosphoadenosine 5'-phosphosulfate sulfotransferase (PAPS reductase)/FAD synthetase
MDDFDALLGDVPMRPRFVIFTSYGNDSVALIQWAHDQGLRDVVCVYSDTGWAARLWAERVEKLEAWTRGLGFRTARTSSIGFVGLARQKKAFPTQMVQWCSGILKIEPGERWLAENDPDKRAVCLVGVRREEGIDRKSFPIFNANSNSHGGRVMLAPMAEWTAETRDAFLVRAGVEPLPHRSMECFPCINSNKADLKLLAEDEERIAEIEALEIEMGIKGPRTKNGKIRGALFRPANRMGAVGIREVVKWAQSGKGKYRAPDTDEFDALLGDPVDDLDEPQPGCEAGWCGI